MPAQTMPAAEISQRLVELCSRVLEADGSLPRMRVRAREEMSTTLTQPRQAELRANIFKHMLGKNAEQPLLFDRIESECGPRGK
jgi:hypothetical protein